MSEEQLPGAITATPSQQALLIGRDGVLPSFELTAAAALRRAAAVPGTGARVVTTCEVHEWRGLMLWKDERGWHYDGPVGLAPRTVRRSGRGPYWRGPVTRGFAAQLKSKLLKQKAQEAENNGGV